MTWDSGASVSPSDIPPRWYVIVSVMKSPITSRIDIMRRLSLTVGYCRCTNRGIRRPEASSIARLIRIPSIGFVVKLVLGKQTSQAGDSQGYTYNDSPCCNRVRHDERVWMEIPWNIQRVRQHRISVEWYHQDFECFRIIGPEDSKRKDGYAVSSGPTCLATVERMYLLDAIVLQALFLMP